MSTAPAVAPATLVLASTSRYRSALLSRLTTSFRTVAPDTDETPMAGEAPMALALRLASAKAVAVAARCPGAIVIGSDQVAEIAGGTLGKPGSIAAACAQLALCSGRSVAFHTALCVVDARTATGSTRSAIDTTTVVFRTLARAEIERYVALENPLDCAGSFKAEGLGIALFERIETTDPTALIGLPLIQLAKLLREMGVAIP
jgi:septum formation protein